MTKANFLSLFLLMCCTMLMAQTKVGGVVKDQNGEALPFVNVIFNNSSEGTTSGENGKFYLQSENNHTELKVSFIGYKTEIIPLQQKTNLSLEIELQEETSSLGEVKIVRGKTSKKNNPAIDILKKIWENKRDNGVSAFKQYQYKKYEKLEFDLDGIDSSVVKNPIFNGMEFIFDYSDTNRISGKTILPVFINESVSMVYGDNIENEKREDLLGNKNSGFEQNQNLIAAVKDVYDEYNVYNNYIKVFDKSFVSPLSTTGINNYNYVLSDSTYIEDKWCYNIIYYPRRENELTFKGDFWVNDTTWAVKKINLEASRDTNINWVKELYIEQEFEVLNDSVFLISKDYFQANFSLTKKENSKGVYAKRTRVFDEYQFNIKKAEDFYDKRAYKFNEEVYIRDKQFWKENRLEELNREEEDVYVMLDSLTRVPAFNRIYDIATIAESGYVEFDGWDFGPVYSLFDYNQVEGFRTRVGGRTYFGQHDPWRIEGYLAYGFKDDKFKYGISGKWLLDSRSRLIISGGKRRDIEQLGASLTTNTTDVLGRSLASSGLVSVGDNDKLSNIDLSTVNLEIEPWYNFNVRFGVSYRELSSASPAFSLDYYTNEAQTETASTIKQTEISTILTYTPGRQTSGFGVERNVVNEEEFPTFFFNYTLGLKNVFNSDFNYKKVQFFYDQPLRIGGFGRANASLEAGKTFGEVPLGLLNVVPGNQTYFAMYNSFPVLNFYEFVTDTYVSAHFDHNFNGRLFARIPLLRELNLRELIGARAVWGEISEENKALNASGIPLRAPSRAPYYEYSIGVGNILKFLSIEAHFRGNYFDVPESRSFAVTASFGFHF
ncbi:DUF5686 and carboxypeptidase-like regulatory domain-containing protein [Salegentibacter mishustinae]|uniref:Collagen-binding protein n=1 Tax=Salegentibacter mishustinae TaxID=270918 RepID=A0A0Q9ZN43_9FLAO|nr:DUF5686 and carboxypeptidase-like regulatory domain-containing protein [Salegentibacter mishustinae]KRG30734.1 hypothetical protein APR42_02405 [Salegentibacter mishustinae]PNW23623.1 hypothetical protein APB85_02400 [Salegentibacter mishustinae]